MVDKRKCNKIQHRIECEACGYSLSEARYMDDTPPLPCNAPDIRMQVHIVGCNEYGIPPRKEKV